ncbi:MAG: helix-turn-helix transcriptional regulator [Lachnospiraceae bacterium]|nr:helix-turn-helix transcriptional regulator [Lachnospiraceae bacterium]
MEQIDLSGLQICHLDADRHSVLREKRVVLGMTQQQVADKASIILQQYQKFESGERDIMTSSFRTACKVIEALEMDITNFYHGEYTIGEGVYPSAEGLRYQKTGRLINEG